MLFVFGTRGTTFAGPRKKGIPCRVCGQDEHVTSGALRYFHVFFVPIFPTKKQLAMQCVHCKKALVGDEIPERTRHEIAALVFPRRRTAPMFSGTIAAALLVLFVATVGKAESDRQASYLRSPAAGDCYVVTLAGIGRSTDAAHPYGILQAVSVTDGQVRLRVASHAFASGTGALKALRNGATAEGAFFAPATLALSVEELQRLKSSGAIYSVKRP